MTNISNVINVSLQADQQLALSDNMNQVAIITTDRAYLNSNNRYAVYADIDEVAQDFGSSNLVTTFAQTFFAQQPNPVNSGGELIIGYWRSSSETTPATAGYLKGGQLNTQEVIAELQKITAGEMSITVDGGTPQNLTDLNFSSISSMEDIVTVLNTAITGATVSYANLQLTITSDTTGATSSLTFATGTGDDFIGPVLSLTDGSGASLVAGVASGTLTAETEEEALAELSTLVTFKGFMFIDESIDAQRLKIAEWAQANNALAYDVFTGTNALVKDPQYVPWGAKLSGYTNYRMLYSTANNRKFACAYMSRAHTVNFNAENTALTMNLKTLSGVLPEDYTQTQIQAAKTIGLDLYTTIKNVPVVLCSSGNDFVDNRYNLLSFIEETTVELFNVLKQTPTKIPQTTQGVNVLVDTIDKLAQRYVRASVFAPGTWSSSNTFGNLDVFNRAIEQNGYYILAGLLADQSQQDRQERKSPVIQVAVKNSGAIHQVDVIINFNI